MRRLRGSSPALVWSGVAVCVVLAFVIVGTLLAAVAPAPSGRALSAYATTPSGLAAWAELLERDGHRVSEIRRPLATVALPANGTLVILGGRQVLTAADSRAVTRFVSAGGRLVIGGSPGAQATGLRGRVIQLAGAGFLENRELGHGDNAYRALSIAGAPSRPVLFDEVVHGYGPATGLAALPERWWFAIVLLALALGSWALSHAVRLGGADPVAPAPAGPRTGYVEAMAQTLVRTGGSRELALRAQAVAAAEENFREIL